MRELKVRNVVTRRKSAPSDDDAAAVKVSHVKTDIGPAVRLPMLREAVSDRRSSRSLFSRIMS